MPLISAIAMAASLLAAPDPPARHIELVSSFPAADTVLVEPPAELILTFSAELDFERSTVSLRGPNGTVALSAARSAEEPRVLRMQIASAVAPGSYLVAWTAAPVGDHGGRGRFRFEVAD